MLMKIAVVILNWNGVQLLEQFLPSIVKYSPDANIYVADNASTDNSIEYIKQNFPSVTIITNKRNFGFAQGYNEALKGLNEEIYALVNSDIEVTLNWLQPIIERFSTIKNVAIIQPKILDYKNKTHFEYAGAAGGFIDKYGFPFCRGRIFDTIEADLSQYNDAIKIFWASGACFFIRSDVFHNLKGFDDDFFAHQEEIDLCWRANNNGYEIMFEPKSVVYHVGGATLNEVNPQKTYLNFRNSLLMLCKNLPHNRLFPIIFIRLCFDGIAGIKFIFEGKFQHCLAIIRSHFAFYKNFSKTYKKRDVTQLSNYYKTKSIVINYFIKNGKIFGQQKFN